MAVRVAFLPNTTQWDAKPYLPLLRQALAEQGATVVDVNNDFLSTRWLWAKRGQVDVLHFHWIQYHYLIAPQVGSTAALVHFLRKLVWARLLGYQIVWTMHNTLPHERAGGNIDVVARRAMALLAHKVLVLCEDGIRQLAEQFNRRKLVYLTPHGHFVGVYPDCVSRVQARARLNLRPNDFVYLFFGGVRPHKNIEALLETFADLPGENVRLLIVGGARGDEIRQRVARLADADHRVITVLDHVPDDDVQSYMKATDAVVLPFSQVLSSSSVIAAMSFGRPVIAPARGCVPEWVVDGCGFVYDPADPNGLRQAMLAAQDANLTAMGRAAYDRVLTYSWDVVAKRTLAAYLETRPKTRLWA